MSLPRGDERNVGLVIVNDDSEEDNYNATKGLI